MTHPFCRYCPGVRVFSARWIASFTRFPQSLDETEPKSPSRATTSATPSSLASSNLSLSDMILRFLPICHPLSVGDNSSLTATSQRVYVSFPGWIRLRPGGYATLNLRFKRLIGIYFLRNINIICLKRIMMCGIVFLPFLIIIHLI